MCAVPTLFEAAAQLAVEALEVGHAMQDFDTPRVGMSSKQTVCNANMA